MDSKPLYLYPISPEELTKTLLSDFNTKIEEILKKYPQTKKEEDTLMTVEETLNFLKCSKQALWNWRKNGILPSYRLGNRVYYRKSDIFTKLVKQD